MISTKAHGTSVVLAKFYPYSKVPTSAEDRARKRRVQAFAKVSALKCLDPRSRESRGLVCNLSNNWWCDHATAWMDPNGKLFILVEPYCSHAPNVPDGFVCVEVPISIAPYCGSFLEGPQATPATRSFLFSKVEDSGELFSIESRLCSAAPIEPRWNSIGRVNRG